MKKYVVLCSLLSVSLQIAAMQLTGSKDRALTGILDQARIGDWKPSTLNYLEAVPLERIAIVNCSSEQEAAYYNTPEAKAHIRKTLIGYLKAVTHDDSTKSKVTVAIDAQRLVPLPQWQPEKQAPSDDTGQAATLAGFTLLAQTPAENITFSDVPDALAHSVRTPQQKEKLRQALLAPGNAVTVFMSGSDEEGNIEQSISVDWKKIALLPTAHVHEAPQPAWLQQLIRPASYVAAGVTCALLGYFVARYNSDTY